MDNVGKINNPLNFCTFDKIKSAGAKTIPCELLVCLTYFDSIKQILISDFNDKSFKVIDLNGNFIGSYNPNSVFERPGPIAASNIVKEIYVEDHILEKVFVFDLNFNYLREFGDERLETPFGMTIDEKAHTIYLSAYLSNAVTIWNTQSGDFLNEIRINSPTFMEVFNNKLIIMSATETEIFTFDNLTEVTSSNAIYIYNKITLEVLNKIKIANYVHPKGLYIDDKFNIYMTAYDIEMYNNSDNDDSSSQLTNSDDAGAPYRTRFFYKFNDSGECVQKTHLPLGSIFSMVVVGKKMFAIRGYRTPPIIIIDFE